MKNIQDKTSRTAEDIVEEAIGFGRGREGRGYHSPVYNVNSKDIQTLLEAGAEVVYLNKPEGEENKREWDNLVTYREHTFSLTTDSEINWEYESDQEITGGEW